MIILGTLAFGGEIFLPTRRLYFKIPTKAGAEGGIVTEPITSTLQLNYRLIFSNLEGAQLLQLQLKELNDYLKLNGL